MHITLESPVLKRSIQEILEPENYTLSVDDRAKLTAALDLLRDTQEDDHSMEHAECETCLAKLFLDSSEKNKKVPVLWKDVLLKAADVLSKVNKSSVLTMNSISFEIEMTENLRDPITLEDMVLPIALSCGHAYAVASLEYLQTCFSCGYNNTTGHTVPNNQIHFLPDEAIKTLFYHTPGEPGDPLQYKNNVMRALAMQDQGRALLMERLDLNGYCSEDSWISLLERYPHDHILIGLLLLHNNPDLLCAIVKAGSSVVSPALIGAMRASYEEREQALYARIIPTLLHSLKKSASLEGKLLAVKVVVCAAVVLVLSLEQRRFSAGTIPIVLLCTALLSLITLGINHGRETLTALQEVLTCRKIAAQLKALSATTPRAGTSRAGFFSHEGAVNNLETNTMRLRD